MDGGRIRGVSCLHADGAIENIQAQLVIDASSNGQLTLNLLVALGIHAPKGTTVGVEMGYSTTMFDIRRDPTVEWRMVGTLPDPPRNPRGAVLLPVEGNYWIVSLAGSHDSKPPDDEAGFMEFAQQVAHAYHLQCHQRRHGCTPITRYGFKASQCRHFETMERLPSGLIPFGDTICRLNPIYGQGMSVAAKEAYLLRDLLQSAAEDGKGTWLPGQRVPGPSSINHRCTVGRGRHS